MAIFKRSVRCHYSYRMMSAQLSRLACSSIVIEKKFMDDQNEEMHFATRLKRFMPQAWRVCPLCQQLVAIQGHSFHDVYSVTSIKLQMFTETSFFHVLKPIEIPHVGASKLWKRRAERRSRKCSSRLSFPSNYPLCSLPTVLTATVRCIPSRSSSPLGPTARRHFDRE